MRMRTDVLTDRAAPPQSPPAGGPADLEAVLVLHYARLVRLAYLALPDTGDSHRRALLAHGIVQQSLPGGTVPAGLRTMAARLPIPGRRVPAQAGRDRGMAGGADPAYAALRTSVVREVLRAPHRRGPGAADLLRPRVWGLRLFPVGGGAEELRLAAALRDATAGERVAYALITLEDLTPRQAEAVLAAAGSTNCRGLGAAGQRLAQAHPAPVARSGEFDPCTLRTRPGDLTQRRRRIRLAAILACGAVVAAGTLLASGGSDDPAPAAAATGGSAVTTARGPVTLAVTPPDLWRRTARLDFSAWPDRSPAPGGAASPAVAEALAAWPADSPATAPVRVLWTGRLDGATVTLLADATRLARYTRPDRPTAADPVRLVLARADDSDVTSAGAVLLRSTDRGDRWLLAPWVAEVTVRDLRAADTPARAVGVAGGVTAAVPRPPAGGCAGWPVLQLRSSPLVAEHHAFLLTDLGGVTGAHLTFTPAPKAGAAAQSPREATGPDALVALSRLACGLPALRDQDTKQVNTWEFALQPLPQNQGTATWVCTRADRWDGTGSAATAFLPAGTGPAVPTGSESGGRSCSRFSQHAVADTRWRAPDGRWYLLLAGSRHVTAFQVAAGAGVPGTIAAPEHTAAVAVSGAAGSAGSAGGAAVPSVAGVLDGGGSVASLGR